MRLRNLDVALVAIAAPIALLAGVPVAGYGIGVATWILLRAFAGAVDRLAGAGDLAQLVALSIGYRFVRVALLVGAVGIAEKALGQDDGLAALAVIVTAFTVQLASSIAGRHGSGRPHPNAPLGAREPAER